MHKWYLLTVYYQTDINIYKRSLFTFEYLEKVLFNKLIPTNYSFQLFCQPPTGFALFTKNGMLVYV